MSTQPPIEGPHNTSRDVPSGFGKWSQAVGDAVPPGGQSRTSQPLLPGIDVTHPLFKVAMVAFIGYTLGRLIHRRK